MYTPDRNEGMRNVMASAPVQAKHLELYEEIESMGIVIEKLNDLLNKIQNSQAIQEKPRADVSSKPSLESLLTIGADELRAKRNYMLDTINQIDCILF
jgi:hypothetical protein